MDNDSQLDDMDETIDQILGSQDEEQTSAEDDDMSGPLRDSELSAIIGESSLVVDYELAHLLNPTRRRKGR